MAVFGSHYHSQGYDNNHLLMLREQIKMQQAQMQQNAMLNQLYPEYSGLQNSQIGGGSACVSACLSGSSVNQCLPPAFVPEQVNYPQQEVKTHPSKGKSMFKEVTTDIKNFILEHRGIIYFIVAALVVDNLFFKGAFKARLQAMADRVVTKVEEKIQ